MFEESEREKTDRRKEKEREALVKKISAIPLATIGRDARFALSLRIGSVRLCTQTGASRTDGETHTHTHKETTREREKSRVSFSPGNHKTTSHGIPDRVLYPRGPAKNSENRASLARSVATAASAAARSDAVSAILREVSVGQAGRLTGCNRFSGSRRFASRRASELLAIVTNFGEPILIFLPGEPVSAGARLLLERSTLADCFAD